MRGRGVQIPDAVWILDAPTRREIACEGGTILAGMRRMQALSRREIVYGGFVSYLFSTVGRGVFVRWQDSSTQAIAALRRAVFDHHASLGGKKLIYVSVSADDSGNPDDGARKAVVKLGEDIMEISDAFYVIVEASGFRGSVLRSALAGMMMLSRKGKSVHVEQSTEKVVRAVAPALGQDPDALVTRLREQGIVPK